MKKMRVYYILLLMMIPVLMFSQVRIKENMEVRVKEGSRVFLPGNLELQNTSSVVNLAGEMTVEGVFANLGNSSNIIIESTELNTGSLIVEGISTANITVERYLSSGQWHFLAPSVNGVTTQDFYYNHNPDVYASYFDEPLNSWEYLSGLTDPMPLGTGYKMWVADAKSPVTAEMEGSIRTTDLSVDLTTDGTSEWSGWNLIGNPFTSALNCADANWGTNTTGVFYVYDSDYNGGDYRYRNSNDGILDSIPISQSFFVYAESAGAYIIPKAAQTHGGAEFYKKKSESPYLRIQLNYKEYGNTMFVGFSEFGTLHFDIPGDADKLYAGSDVPQMYMMEDGRKLCMKLDQPLTNDAREVDLYLDQVADGDYYLNIENLAKLSGTDVLLKDLKTGVEHDFSSNSSFHFQANAGDELLRLRLFFKKKPFGIEEAEQVNDLMQIYYSEGYLYISSVDEAISESGTLIIYDLHGRELHRQDVSAGVEVKIPLHFRNMVLLAKVQKESSQKVEKISLF